MDALALAPSAWVLNFDAEDELSSASHNSSAKTNARIPALVRALGALVASRDIVLDDSNRNANGYVGRAWCPTPRARAKLANAGAIPLAAPDVAILRRVNHRRFAADLGQPLPGARYVVDIDSLRDAIANETSTGHWLLKRPFGFAGRGRRRVAQGLLEPSAETWVQASLKDGEGLQVEPWVDRISDYALHGYLARNEMTTFGAPTHQECDETGAWKGTSRAIDLDSETRDALFASATLVADALAKAGYLGPFGVDAYRYRENGRIVLNARSEINARYSMGWAVGMGECRPDLEDISSG